MLGWTVGLVLALTAWSAAAAPISLTAATAKHGKPGDYVTIPFIAHGDGEVRFTVTAPVGWAVLSPDFSQQIQGRAVLLITVQIRQGATPGLDYPVAVTAYAGGKRVASAQQHVVVDRSAAVAVRGPTLVQSLPGQAHSFDVVVVNEGNFRDTFGLLASGTIFDATVAPRSVTLDPGASTNVKVTVSPSGGVSNGLSQVVTIRAVSAFDETATDRLRIQDRYFNPALATTFGHPGQHAPQLVFGVDALANGELDLAPHGTSGSFDYSVTPDLHGDLSDFMTGSVGTSTLSGDQAHPLPGIPGLHVGLAGDTWGATAGLRVDGIDLAGSVQLDPWTLNATANYAWSDGAYGASVRADQQLASSDLQLSAQTQRTPFQGATYGSDALRASYSHDLGLGFIGQVGVEGLGLLQPGTPYQLIPQLDEQLSWQGHGFDALQSYTGQPTLGLHTVTLTGGTTSLQPFGVRTKNVLELRDGAYDLTSSLGLYGGVTLGSTDRYGATLSWLTYRLVGGVDLGTSAASARQYTVTPGLSFNLVSPGGVSTAVGGSYSLARGMSGTSGTDTYQASFSVLYRNLSGAVNGYYRHTFDAGRGASHQVNVQASAAYALGSDTLFQAVYRYTESEQPAVGAYVVHDSGAATWQQDWTVGLSSQLSYKLDVYPFLPSLSTDALELSALYAPVTIPGLHLRATYDLESPFGQWTLAGMTHRFKLEVGYSLALPFATPSAVVSTFGGRKTGRVHGKAYVEDASGQAKPLAGLAIELGKTTITTGSDGSFDRRVPVGTYQVAFGSGLPATVGYFGHRTVDVKRDQTLTLDLPFRPVGSLNVLLYDDLNRNGRFDGEEKGIPYGGVTVDGPVHRTARVDDSGRVLVTDLPAGTYTVAPDPAELPQGYQATGSPVTVTLAAGEKGVPVATGAALPPPRVITTFVQGALSIYVQTTPQSVPAGADVSLRVQVGGGAEKVSADANGETVALREQGGAWVGRLRVPLDAPPGPLSMTVTARSGEKQVSQTVTVNVVHAPPFKAVSYVFHAGTQGDIEVDTLFKAQRVDIALPGEPPLELASKDGYTWTGVWKVPAKPGSLTGTVVADGQTIGTIDISVVPPANGGSK